MKTLTAYINEKTIKIQTYYEFNGQYYYEKAGHDPEKGGIKVPKKAYFAIVREAGTINTLQKAK